MPDFSFRDRPDKQRVQLTLGKASSSADAEQVLAFLDFQWTFRTMQATYEQLLDQYQLSESKFIILMLLENETDHTLLPSELATKLGSARATVSKLLVGLQKRGWVEKQHPQDDKRTVAIHLTAAGSSVLTQFYRPILRRLQQFLRRLRFKSSSSLKAYWIKSSKAPNN